LAMLAGYQNPDAVMGCQPRVFAAEPVRARFLFGLARVRVWKTTVEQI